MRVPRPVTAPFSCDHRYLRQRKPRAASVRLVAGLALCLLSVGCGPTPEDCQRAEIRCAGLVTDFGSVEDGISGQAWLALQDARAAGFLQRADYIETVDTRDRQTNILTFARMGYDVIVTVGAGMADETISAAREFPGLSFVGIRQEPSAGNGIENYSVLTFPEEEAGFLAGAVAGLVTRTGHVVAVCEERFIDSIRRACEGFRLGVSHVKPEATVDVIFRSGASELLYRDVEWGQAAALSAIELGADVLFAIGKQTADAALKAAVRRGAVVIGAETDQYPVLAEIRPQLITSAVLDVRAGLFGLLEASDNGSAVAGEYRGEVELAPLHEYEGRFSPLAFAELEAIAAALRGGTLQVDVPP
jgi:basic membrane protein A